MTVLVERLLRLHPGEGRRGLLLFTYLFLIIASFVASKAARDALFLERFSAVQLPYVDIATTLVVGVVVSIYIRAGRLFSLHALQVGSLLILSAISLLFWALGEAGEPAWLFPVVYVWVGTFGVLAPAQVWTLANFVFTTRAAKRAFGLVGSGAIAGWIAGGFVTQATATRFGTESTLLGVSIALAAAAGLVVLTWRERPDGFGEHVQEERTRGGLRESAALVWRSPYLRAIAGVILVSSFVTTIAGWQFKAIAKAEIPDTDALTAFFGAFNFWAGLASLAAQLLLTSRLLRRFGIGFGLLIVPVTLAMGTAGVLATAGLLAAVFLKGSDQVLRYSIDKATVELLYLPVPGADTFRAKSFIDTVVWRAGDGLAGLTVLLFAAGFGVSAAGLGWVNLALVGVWLAAALAARRQYVRNLTDSIHGYRLDTERAAVAALDRTSIDIVAARLASADTADVLYALDVFESERRKVTHPALRALLTHASPDVRQRAIRLLAAAGDTSVKAAVERLLYDGHLEVRTEALLYLTQHAHIDPLERIEELGAFPDYSIRAGMVAFLARPGAAQNLDAAALMLQAMVREGGPEGRGARREAARLLGRLPEGFEPQLRLLLQDEDPDIVREAVASAGAMRSRALIPDLVQCLRLPLAVPDALDALERFGDAAVDVLRARLLDNRVPREIRREIPQLLLRIGTPRAQAVLVEAVCERDTRIRFRIITALNKLTQLNPHWRVDRRAVELVLHAEILGLYRSYQALGALHRSHAAGPALDAAVRESIGHETERIFRLLKVLYPDADMHSAYVSLTSDNVVVHDHALEFVDTILSPRLREMLLPLLDGDVTTEQRVRIADAMIGLPIRTADEAMRVLDASGEPWLQAALRQEV